MSFDHRSVVTPPSRLEKALLDAILRVKRGPLCVVCGNEKQSGRWFDKTCYFSLPPAMRGKLWTVHHMTDQELRENFLAAVDHLVSNVQRFVHPQRMPLEAQKIIAETRFSDSLTAFLAGVVEPSIGGQSL